MMLPYLVSPGGSLSAKSSCKGCRSGSLLRCRGIARERTDPLFPGVLDGCRDNCLPTVGFDFVELPGVGGTLRGVERSGRGPVPVPVPVLLTALRARETAETFFLPN
jgi:hypothetical protein